MTDTKTKGKAEAQREAALLDQLLEGCNQPENLLACRQMPEVQTRGGVGHAFGAEVNAGKTLLRLPVVARVFKRFVSQAPPLLEEIDAQHALQAEGRATTLALGIMRHRSRLGV